MEGELRGAFRQLTERFQKMASGREDQQWRVLHVDGALAAGRAELLGQTEEPVTALLRSVVSETARVAPWVPYWRLTGIGGRLSWSSPLDNPSAPPQGTDGPIDLGEVQSWLCKGNATGLLVPVVLRGPVLDATSQ